MKPTHAPTEFTPSRAAAMQRLHALDLAAYASTRNNLGGAVTYLSPYLTHGLLGLADAGRAAKRLTGFQAQHKFVFELGWRAYFQHVWEYLGDGIFESIHPGPLPDSGYSQTLPDDIRQGRTGVPAIDQAVRSLYATGYVHNHARMWLASYVVHMRRVHWRVGAAWLYAHLLDGDLASNALSWQWVAGTGSSKPYLFNADNVAKYAPRSWHSPNTGIDNSYEALDEVAKGRVPFKLQQQGTSELEAITEPEVFDHPPEALTVQQGIQAPGEAAAVAASTALTALCRNQPVALLHAWSAAPSPAAQLARNVKTVAVLDADFHAQHPWSAARWRFVLQSFLSAGVAPQHIFFLPRAQLVKALAGASVISAQDNLHAAGLLEDLYTACTDTLELTAEPQTFASVDSYCSSFSKWWQRTRLVV